MSEIDELLKSLVSVKDTHWRIVDGRAEENPIYYNPNGPEAATVIHQLIAERDSAYAKGLEDGVNPNMLTNAELKVIDRHCDWQCI